MAAAPAAASAAGRAIFCELGPKSLGTPARRESPAIPRLRSTDPSTEGGKLMLQPRLCTLRSYSDDRMIRAVQKDAGDASTFFASLAAYIESSKKSQDFETVSGRLAMMAFATAVTVELVTGNSLFKKLDLQQLAEAGGLCMAVVASAAAFAWVSSARTKIGQMFNVGCNSLVDSLIDNIVDGLFYESESSDWSDEI